MRPGGGTSPMIDKAVTVLPHADSPTRPSVSPRLIEKLMSSTARSSRDTPSRSTVNAVERFVTRSSGAAEVMASEVAGYRLQVTGYRNSPDAFPVT